MARGRRRGRGRGRKPSVMEDSSSIGTHMEEKDSQQPEQVQQDEVNYEDELTTSTKGARKLSFEPQCTKEMERGSLDLKGFEDEVHVEGNGTGSNSAESKDKVDQVEIDQEQKKQAAEPWVNMFKNNRVASNGMKLSYVPPQVVDGQAVVQLEEKELHEEEQKWKCALIAYVIGEPGYNTMKRYIMVNWANVSKLEVFLHEDGYYLIKFQKLSDMNEVLFSGPYSINNRPIILKQWCPEFDFGNEFLTEIPL